MKNITKILLLHSKGLIAVTLIAMVVNIVLCSVP
jgi:hypothetical protein